MSQLHLFVMDPLSQLKPHLDTSLALAFALSQKGDTCYMVTPDKLLWRLGEEPTAYCQVLVFPEADVKSVTAEIANFVELSTFSSIHLRQEPPFDMKYLTTTWILDQVCDRVPVWNAPNAVRAYNEKLSIFQFPEYTASGVLTGSKEIANDFLDQHGHIILKPLDLFGGQGIVDIDSKDPNASEQLQKCLLHGPRLMRPFDTSVYDGEVRAFTLDGQAIGWCLKSEQTLPVDLYLVQQLAF